MKIPFAVIDSNIGGVVAEIPFSLNLTRICCGEQQGTQAILWLCVTHVITPSSLVLCSGSTRWQYFIIIMMTDFPPIFLNEVR